MFVFKSGPYFEYFYKEVALKGRYYTNCTMFKVFSGKFNIQLDCKEKDRILFRIANDYRSHKFQYMVLHWYLEMNTFLHKIGLTSLIFSFYKGESESIELLSIECDFSNRFWQDLSGS